MKLIPSKFGLSCAFTAALLWLACSVLVAMLPAAMLSLSGDMFHMQLSAMGWHLTWTGVLIGLIAWSIVAGLTGATLAAIYNRLA
ncbi:DUF5676 family membrane protein [Pseudomarimonas arenosa]|uniref:Uncharacterized protein n=1 Tax=Pseudomarimonas arenosa TaxID=2774145 RepID=A0AAW3ZIW6_9GAMM|nr:DUF5676 family membrane protein [Pseudomarimonas arenosa]MBD8524411.1 hypothetical protein [Pseudomarimonas arenosa]